MGEAGKEKKHERPNRWLSWLMVMIQYNDNDDDYGCKLVLGF